MFGTPTLMRSYVHMCTNTHSSRKMLTNKITNAYRIYLIN